MAAPRIDAHFHLWRIAQYDDSWMTGPFVPLKRDFLPEHLAPLLRACGIDGAVFVQPQHDVADNDWLLELSEHHDWIRGVVGWVDLTDPRVEATLERWIDHPRFCGVRHLTHNEADDDWILRDDVQRGLGVLERRGVPFDLLFFVRHLRHAATVAGRFPDLPLVVDHLGKPHIRERRVDDWLPAFREAARHANVCCKLSGMVTEADWGAWTPDDLRVYVQHALELFGPERLMFGSDWPVCTLAGDYRRVHDALETALGPITDAERDAIFGGTARRFYRLPI